MSTTSCRCVLQQPYEYSHPHAQARRYRSAAALTCEASWPPRACSACPPVHRWAICASHGAHCRRAADPTRAGRCARNFPSETHTTFCPSHRTPRRGVPTERSAEPTRPAHPPSSSPLPNGRSPSSPQPSPAQPHAEPRAPTAAAEAIFSAAGRTRNMADRGGLEALDRGLAAGQEAAPAPPPGSATRSRTSAARVAAALSDCCRYALFSCRYALLSRRYRRNSTTLSSRPRQNGGALWREPCVTQRGRAEAEP